MTQLLLINLCIHPGCGRRALNKVKPGYCNMHHKRMWRHGCADTRKLGGRAVSQGPYCTLYIARRGEQYYWVTKINGVNVFVHRIIAERRLGRPLTPDEQVHHIDGNGLYNAPHNLEVLHASEHGRVSVTKRWEGEEPF